MLNILPIDRTKFEKDIFFGYIEYFNDIKYYKFLNANNLLNYDDDSINSFKNRGYSNSKKFRMVLSKNFKSKYIEKINNDLLTTMASIINPKEFNESDTKLIIDDKISLVALIGFIYFEPISSDLNLDEFENKFSILKYLAEQQFSSNKNNLNLSIDDYRYLKDHPRLFCARITDMTLYKSKDEIAQIINNISETVNISKFNDACSIYEQQTFGIAYKKM